jgi:hypothetical protein
LKAGRYVECKSRGETFAWNEWRVASGPLPKTKMKKYYTTKNKIKNKKIKNKNK